MEYRVKSKWEIASDYCKTTATKRKQQTKDIQSNHFCKWQGEQRVFPSDDVIELHTGREEFFVTKFRQFVESLKGKKHIKKEIKEILNPLYKQERAINLIGRSCFLTKKANQRLNLTRWKNPKYWNTQIWKVRMLDWIWPYFQRQRMLSSHINQVTMSSQRILKNILDLFPPDGAPNLFNQTRRKQQKWWVACLMLK